MKQNYNKHYLTPKQIVELLKNERGLIFYDEEKAEEYLMNIGYHRLSAYIYPFYQVPIYGKKVKSGTTFDDVMTLYRFDRKLRILLFNGIEKIEIAIRSILANKGCGEFGDEFWITNHRYFDDIKNFMQTIQTIEKELDSSREDYIKNFLKSYKDQYPPAWMLSEVLSFGNLNHIYSNIANNQLKKDIANYFGMVPKVFSSWLTSLVNTRNICCHHARMWNRKFVIVPVNAHTLQNKWIDTAHINRARVYYRICIVKYFLDTVAPQNKMRDKLVDLFNRYPQIDLSTMGFPTNWDSEPLWQ